MFRVISVMLMFLSQSVSAETTCRFVNDSLLQKTSGKNVHCSFSTTQESTRSTLCQWEFPFRSSEAQTQFAKVRAALLSCFGTDISVTGDQEVNHPDTYFLQTFETDNGNVRLSLKDKGALQKTFVFMQILPKAE